MGLQPHSKVLRKQPGTIDNTPNPQLIKKAGAPCLYLDRIRYGNDIPVGLQYCTIITERSPDIARHDFTTASLFNVLTTSYHLQIAEIYHVVNAILADEETGKLLGTKPGAPLLIEKSVTYLQTANPSKQRTLLSGPNTNTVSASSIGVMNASRFRADPKHHPKFLEAV